MNTYDLVLQRQKELKEEFNNSKTAAEKEAIKEISSKFLGRQGVSKAEYNQLIKYYFNVDLLDTLKYEQYKATNFIKMKDKKEVYILDRVVRACFILG